MDGSSVAIPVTDQAATSSSASQAMGNDRIPYDAQYPNQQEFQSSLESTSHQNGTKVIEQNIHDADLFDAVHDDLSIGGHGIEDGPGDEDSLDTTWSESTSVPRRNLGFVQTTSLMLNTTIGSGIFNTPGYVLALTRSKRVSLILWAVGGVYSALR